MKARRGNRKAFWWLSNLWYKPAYLMSVIGGIVVILLLTGGGAVRGAACLQGVGCVSWGAQGVVTTPDESVTVRAP